MKKCPSCDKTYEDSMRFCQSDGTPLVEDAPPLDPYKTIVARPVDRSESEPPMTIPEPVAPASAGPIGEPEDLLDLPDADPLKTMYVSEEEMRKAMGSGGDADDPPIEISPEPTPPKFIESEVAFGSQDQSAPPSPFGSASPNADRNASTPAIPSPFDMPDRSVEPPRSPDRPPMFTEPPPAAPPYTERATVVQDFPPASPFGSADASFSVPQDPPPVEPAYKDPEPYRPAVMDAPSPFQQDNSPAAWTPPPSPEASWQNQEVGQNVGFQPPAVSGGLNQTLPIVSLVLGIASLCCYVSPITGIAALVTGYLGLKNANTDPNTYGGKGLAIAGMVTGGLFLLLGLIYWILIIVGIGMGSINL